MTTASNPPPPGAGQFRKASEMKRGTAIVLYGPEGWGKSSFAAHIPNVAFFEARDENGLTKLAEHKRIPDVPVMKIDTWPQLLREIDAMIANGCDYKFLAFDALSGFERLCHEEVCRREHGNVWGEKGFLGFMRGYHQSVTDWMMLLKRLDTLRDKHMTNVIGLGHAQIKTHKNPIGPDFDRYVCDINEKTWGVTHKWSDIVLFGNFVSIVDEDKNRRARGIGGQDRVIYTEHSDALDAKNRFGLPEVIDIPNDPARGFDALVNAMKASKPS